MKNGPNLNTQPAALTPAAVASAARLDGSMHAGMQVLADWQVFMTAGANLIRDNVEATAVELKNFSACKTPEEFGTASVAFGQSMAQHWLDSSQKLAALSTEYANRRFRPDGHLASSALSQLREG